MENYKNESMIDVAYSVLKNMDDKISFKDLYEKVCELIGLSGEEAANKMSKFYTNLSLDGRFSALKNGEWNLKERCVYDDKDDFNLFYDDIDNEEKANKDVEELDEDETNEDDEDGDELDIDKESSSNDID